MKQPTRAAWVKALKAYEDQVLNPALPHLSEAEKDLLFATHDVIRSRASGVEAVVVDIRGWSVLGDFKDPRAM